MAWTGQRIFLKRDANIKANNQDDDEKADVADVTFPQYVYDQKGELLRIASGWVLASNALHDE